VTTSADGRFIIAGETGVWDKKSSIKIFAIENAREVHHFENIHEGRIKSIAVSPNGKYLVSSETEGIVQITDLASRKSTYKYNVVDEGNKILLSLIITSFRLMGAECQCSCDHFG